MTDYHPIVNDVIACLAGSGPSGSLPYQITSEGASEISSKLAGLSANQGEFQSAVSDLLSFCMFLEEKNKSPEAAAVILEILGSNPDIERGAAEFVRSSSAEQVAQVAQQFARFSETRSAAEEKIETSEPMLSAADLLRSVRMHG